MTILKIYKLEDPEEADALSTLSEGEHIIGRGFLNCNDKRVSRKHARIVIEKNEVTIKSEHVNPCFHKSFVSNSISILPKDKSVILNDNDQFALLSDNFWFRVKVIKDNEGPIIGKREVSENIGDNQLENIGIPIKRNIDSSTNSSPIKRQKTSSETISPLQIPDLAVANRLLANLQTIVAEDYGDSSEANNSLNNTTCRSYKNVSDDESSNNGKAEEALVTSSSILEENVQNEEKGEVKPDIKSIDMLLKTENSEPPIIEQSIKDEPSTSTTVEIQGSEDTNKNEEESTNLDENNVINEPSGVESVNNANNEDDNVHKPSDNTNNAYNNVNDTTDNANNIFDNGNNAPTLKTRRDRCWYGQTCYRKNPHHQINFSHPGDDDYDSDPNDDRPNCPFGDSCYRVNLDHRREFKHRGKPASKPRDPDPSSPGTSNQTPKPKKKRNKKKPPRKKANSDESNVESDDTNVIGTDQNTPPRKKRKAAQKKVKLNETPEDDYDYEDPFIDDDSSEEFKVSDADEDDDDSDWEDSQQVDEESQETRRLLKEAKKFTKRKK